MSEKRRHGRQRNHARPQPQACAQHLRQKHGQPALTGIAEQGQQGGHFVAAAQYVGRAGVPGTVAARVGQAEQAAGDHGKGDRADEIGRRQHGHGKQQG